MLDFILFYFYMCSPPYGKITASTLGLMVQWLYTCLHNMMVESKRLQWPRISG